MQQGTPKGQALPDSLRSVLDRTVGVLRQTEHLLFKRAHVRWKMTEVILDSTWHGPSFVLTGLGEQMRLLCVRALLVAVWWGALLPSR
jgi:hypothetical protein